MKSTPWIAQSNLLAAFYSRGGREPAVPPHLQDLYWVPHVAGAQMILSAFFFFFLWQSLKRNVCAANVQEHRAACGQALH